MSGRYLIDTNAIINLLKDEEAKFFLNERGCSIDKKIL